METAVEKICIPTDVCWATVPQLTPVHKIIPFMGFTSYKIKQHNVMFRISHKGNKEFSWIQRKFMCNSQSVCFTTCSRSFTLSTGHINELGYCFSIWLRNFSVQQKGARVSTRRKGVNTIPSYEQGATEAQTWPGAVQEKDGRSYGADYSHSQQQHMRNTRVSASKAFRDKCSLIIAPLPALSIRTDLQKRNPTVN